MFNWILKNLLGGETGKRELALCVMFIWLIGVPLVDVAALLGAQMPFTRWFLESFALMPFGLVAAAFGFDAAVKQMNVRYRRDNSK